MNGEHKITSSHRDRAALIYLRQSLMAQVRDHTESTRSQYGLAETAAGLGWARTSIEVIDTDLGISGKWGVAREGFTELVTRVCSGGAGAIFGIEITRLARSNADVARLAEFARITGTLLIDPDGVYDPADVNDRVLLGFKGTMGEHLCRYRHKCSPVHISFGLAHSNRPNAHCSSSGPGAGRFSSSLSNSRCRVRSDGAHPDVTCRTCAAVRPGFSRFSASASASTSSGVRGAGCRGTAPAHRTRRTHTACATGSASHHDTVTRRPPGPSWTRLASSLARQPRSAWLSPGSRSSCTSEYRNRPVSRARSTRFL